MSLFTFLSEVRGSTIVEQCRAGNVRDAVLLWGRTSKVGPQFNDDIVTVDITPVTGLAKVWCISGLTEESGDLFITHIVGAV